MRSGYASHADVIRHQKFPSGVTIVGIAPVEIAFIVAVRGLRRGIHDGPVGVVSEQEVRILGQLLRFLHWWSGDETFLVAFAFDVPELQWIAAAERHLPAAVQHLAADVEILINKDDRRAEVARANGGWQPDAARADDDDIRLVVPAYGV